MNKAMKMFVSVVLTLAVVGAARAAQVNIGDGNNANGPTLIDTSTTWTANNTYNLTEQVYVTNGATLTIEAGTVIASVPSVNGAGSLAITRGSKIVAVGTADRPIIFTSSSDVATWTGSNVDGSGNVIQPGNPKTGTWREAANEWGNLTIMGRAYTQDTKNPALIPPQGTNVRTPSATNISIMEGLTEQVAGDPNVRFGGGDDDDDSGTIAYCSFRYGGRVVGLGNELNGLSLGAIGRSTNIHHIEIMNNVDDGIEIWGGTVNLKYVTIWNIGDDSFDNDQGYRGMVQFLLIVQGYSLDTSSGSGVADQCFEIDGPDGFTDAQPTAAICIYNFTAIGQPGNNGGDHGWEPRDNANVQFRNGIFMDIGKEVIRDGKTDGEGSTGYGFDPDGAGPELPTLTYAERYTTPFTYLHGVNNGPVTAAAAPGPNSHPDGPTSAAQVALYQAQNKDANVGIGALIEFTGDIFWNNTFADAYTQAIARGVLAAGPADNASLDNRVANALPIRSITRAASIVKGGRDMQQVIKLDPRAANGAATLNGAAPAPLNGFYTPAAYRGAFGPNNNWALGWTAADAYGFYETTTGAPQVDSVQGQIEVKLTTINFDTTAGVTYVIDCSTDGGKTFQPVASVDGTPARNVSVQSTLGASFDSSAIYKVTPQ